MMVLSPAMSTLVCGGARGGREGGRIAGGHKRWAQWQTEAAGSLRWTLRRQLTTRGCGVGGAEAADGVLQSEVVVKIPAAGLSSLPSGKEALIRASTTTPPVA